MEIKFKRKDGDTAVIIRKFCKRRLGPKKMAFVIYFSEQEDFPEVFRQLYKAKELLESGKSIILQVDAGRMQNFFYPLTAFD